MGHVKPKTEPKMESLIKELLKTPLYSPSAARETPNPYYSHYTSSTPKISLSDIAARHPPLPWLRRFNIVDRRPIGTPLTRVESGMGKLMHYYGMRISTDEDHYFPKRAVVLSFHEPEEPAEVLLFWDEESATEIYEEWFKGLLDIHGPWVLTLYRIGEGGYALPQGEDVDLVLNMKNEVVDVRWPDSLIISWDHGLVGLEGFAPWASMIKPPPVEAVLCYEDMTRNPCGEISLTGESSLPSYTSIARKLLAVEELPAGAALIAYERASDKCENPEKQLAHEGKSL